MKRSILLLLLMSMGSLASGQFSAEVVKSFALDNGMKILVYEDHSIPNANMYLFYRVGSRNEYPGITGLSHFFEHMMFNGAKKYGPKEFDRVMEASGGSNNAYTTNDVTVYTDWFPTKSLEVIFDLEADRIGNLAIDPGMVESERGVVLSERSTGLENSNFERLSTQVHAAAFFAHPYKWPVIGYESDIKSWTQADLEWYFKTYYAPNNCVVVIAGDVQLETVKALAQKYFSPLAAQPAPAPLRTVEPPQEGLKRVTVLKDVSTPNLEIVHHVPQASHPDYYALDMLNAILSSGPSSRLQKSLVFEQELATEIWTYMPASMDPDLFVTFAVAADGVDAGKLESAILNEIDRIVREGVTDAELRKVKNQKSMEFYRSIETINGKANSLGTFELFFGDYKRMFEAPALYEKVTREDIQRVAATYFIEKNRTIGYLMPEEKKP